MHVHDAQSRDEGKESMGREDSGMVGINIEGATPGEKADTPLDQASTGCLCIVLADCQAMHAFSILFKA